MSNTIKCPHCGADLEPMTVSFGGREYCIGHAPCMCPEARRERYEAEMEEQRMQAEAETAALDAKMARAGIPPRFRSASHERSEECADAVRNGMNVYLHGPVGTGKTTLAAATAATLLKDGARVKFSSMRSILSEIKASFNGGEDTVGRYETAQVLVLDDLGKESPTDFALERLFDLVDSRSANMLPTIVTTQYKPSMLIERLAKNGDKDTAIAIVSRLRGEGIAIEFSGKDRRLA